MILPININSSNVYYPKTSFRGNFAGSNYIKNPALDEFLKEDSPIRNQGVSVFGFLNVIKDRNIQYLLDKKAISYQDVADIVEYPVFNFMRNFSTRKIVSSLNNDIARQFVSDYHLELHQAPYVLNLPQEQLGSFHEAIQEFPEGSIIKTNIIKLQNQEGYQIKAKVKRQLDEETHAIVGLDITVNPDCTIQTTRVEDLYYDLSSSRVKNSQTEFIITTKDPQTPYVSDILEVTPQYVKQYKLSDKMQGAWNIRTFYYKDYPEDLDILEGVQKGTIEGGHPSTNIIEKEKSIVYKEIFSYLDTQTKRRYEESYDGTKRDYEYHITQSYKPIMDIKRSWQKISDNETLTTINNRSYRAVFDDYRRSITITDDKGAKVKINMASKAPSFDFEFLKSLDADILLNMKKYTKSVILAKPNDKRSYNPLSNNITVDKNTFTINHELGHAIDFNTTPRLIKNPELIKIYNEELDNFNKNSTSKMQEIFEYFSNDGGYAQQKGFKNNSRGLDELIAEVNALLYTYNDKELELSTRGMFIVRYFPKTTAQIASLLGYSA